MPIARKTVSREWHTHETLAGINLEALKVHNPLLDEQYKAEFFSIKDHQMSAKCPRTGNTRGFRDGSGHRGRKLAPLQATTAVRKTVPTKNAATANVAAGDIARGTRRSARKVWL